MTVGIAQDVKLNRKNADIWKNGANCTEEDENITCDKCKNADCVLRGKND